MTALPRGLPSFNAIRDHHTMTADKKAAPLPPAPTVCCHCGGPIPPGQPHWAGDPEDRPWHYDCAESMRLTQPLRWPLRWSPAA